MATFGSYSLAQLSALRDELQELASPCATLREAAGLCLDRLRDEFSESLVLGRCFTTLPFMFLPEREKAFARKIATDRGLAKELTDDASVVVLAATRGRKPEWNEVATSRHRLAVPLLTQSCLETIPLVGRVLSATVTDLPWLKQQETLVMTATTGRMSHMVLVEDAVSTVSSDGSKAVRDQDFVRDNGVASVIAMGGRYLNGGSLVLVLFLTERLTQDQATKFPTIVNTIKTATMKAVMATHVL